MERAQVTKKEQGRWLQRAGKSSKQRDNSPEGKSCAEGVDIKETKAAEDRAGETSKGVQDHECQDEKGPQVAE